MLFKNHYQTQLNNRIKNCEGCILRDNPGPVLGYGNFSADIMFIADKPGPVEAKTGIPFTGRAKDSIVNMLKKLNLMKGDYYFTYFFKHTLREDQSLDSVGHANCFKNILYEIELVNPRIICSMGFYITRFLTKSYGMSIVNDSLRDIHGNAYIAPMKIVRSKTVRPKRYLVPTWSPSISNEVMHSHFKKDVLTINSILKFNMLLF